MINTQITQSINVSTNKTDIKDSIKTPQKNETSSKDDLALALKKNLGLLNTKTELADQQTVNFDSKELNLKLQSLINKFLNQLNSEKSPNQNFIKQSTALNFAPNFSNELKFLANEMQKSDVFTEVLKKLEQILKPASETKTSNLAMLFKNSGVFFEAKLKDALNPENLPKSFHSLVNAIKSVSSDKIANEIINLATKDLDPKTSLDELKNIISTEKNLNQETLKSSAFKALLNLSSSLDNFKKYISKNPSLAQEKIEQVATQIMKKLDKLEPSFRKEISKLENLALKDTSFLKNLSQSFAKLKENLQNIIQHKTNEPTQNKTTNPNQNTQQIISSNQNTNKAQNNPSNNITNNTNTQIKDLSNPFYSTETEKNISQTQDTKVQENNNTETKSEINNKDLENKNIENEDVKQQNTDKKSDVNTDKTSVQEDIHTEKHSTKEENLQDDNIDVKKDENKSDIDTESKKENLQKNEVENEVESEVKNDVKEQKNDKDLKKDINNDNVKDNKNTKEQIKDGKEIIKDDKQLPRENIKKENIDNELKTNQNDKIFKQQSETNLNQNTIKQEAVKNLIFVNEKTQMKELENLNQDINKLIKRVNESLKELEPKSLEAKINIKDIKNIDNKIKEALNDIAKITVKNNDDIANELRNDIKSTLLQVSNLAKANDNEAIASQANRLLAQIEINQLISLANSSINTYMPFFWDDLSDSKIIFKRGKKDKYFAQIKLNFAQLGELDVLISLNNEKYIDINIMAENKDFRKRIYENAHELKRALSKVGLLSSNFFVGDIIRSKFDSELLKNRAYDFEMGIDKKA